MPLPDERDALQVPDVTPILLASRLTLGTDRRPLILEELRTGAGRAQLAYRLTAESPAHCTPSTPAVRRLSKADFTYSRARRPPRAPPADDGRAGRCR
ncbi:hypothetical protein ABT168_13310 [Streptomyces sp. NPDC001793]|uniref:hypothetical protein n=1 Tax=Streptomyces sp. NPDC001793 TaxID=3154657 RepID=UPI00332207A1